jgi:hypothetical protein
MWDSSVTRLHQQLDILVHGDAGGNPSDTPTPDQLGANFQKIAEAAARAVTEEGGASDDEFSSAISQTLKNLSEGAENLQVSNGNIINMHYISSCKNKLEL